MVIAATTLYCDASQARLYPRCHSIKVEYGAQVMHAEGFNCRELLGFQGLGAAYHLPSAYRAHKCPLLKVRKHFKAISVSGIFIRTRGSSSLNQPRSLFFRTHARPHSMTTKPGTSSSSVCMLNIREKGPCKPSSSGFPRLCVWLYGGSFVRPSAARPGQA